MKPCRGVVLLIVVSVLGCLMFVPAAPAPAAEGTPAKPAPAAAPATPQSPADTPLVDEKVRQLMQDRNYAEAVKAIDVAAKVKDAPVDYLTWLKGRALYLQNQYDDAIAVFEGIEKQFPKSPWVRRARFAKGVALARKGDFRNAELIYRAEAEYLLSVDRKQEIADLYLEFADTYFKPPKEEQKPDYAKALEFYKKALEVGPKPEKRIEVELLVAQCQQKLGKLDEAAVLYDKFIKEHAASPLDIEARFNLGETRLTQGNFKEARRVWQDLLAKYPDSRVERIAEAAFKLSRTWGVPPIDYRTISGEANVAPNAPAPNPPAQVPAQQAEQARVQQAAAAGGAEGLNLGVAALEAFIEKFPAHKLASQAHLDIAVSYMTHGRYEDAIKSLKRFLADDRYKDREEVADARNFLGRSYQLQGKFTEALKTWQEYLVKHPTHKAWSSVQREIVNTEYLMAREKVQAKQYEAAVKLFNEFMAKYPLDPRNPEILYAFGQMNYAEKKWDAAIAEWRRLVSKYPGTEWASRGQYMIAVTLERHLGKLEEALEEYRKVTSGSSAGPAQAAVARLTAKRMTVATDRAFRSDEKPKLALTTRNVETATVRAYKVDLETYFRKMHLARGVESLDIALISPDKTFEYAIPKYLKHQEQENEVEVPLAGDAKAGVMAVTVSSKTLEATSLMVQSDLDIIVKSSRNEVFVFAENMLTGKPWPEVKLLISNGKEVFAEGVTGKDGVFRGEFKELKDAGDVRVFAIAGPHVASNVVGLQGVGVAQGLADKGYLYSDRPAYRAGQIVHLRGCIRRAANDAYTIDKGKKYTLEVFDSRNRLVRQEKVTLGDFGTFHDHFVLPATSPQGQYRFLVRDEATQNFSGTFLVHEYVLEPVRLVIDTPRKVYYRGEEIEGTIRAEFYYGAPLAGREIRYQLADDRLHTATTDAKGEIKFKLPTREFSETQVLPLAVTLAERNLQTAVNFVLACQGFSINVSTVRPVYVAGETFEATVKTTDAEGKPLAQKLVLQVLERTVIEGKVGERLVEKFDLQTAADGTARQTVKLAKGGRYVLRAEGTDRFKNPITGQNLVQVSDDEDQVRLRILADKYTYKVGDTATVQLHWREEPGLALVTFQGARVLDYKLVNLVKGPNKLEIPMAAHLAPNFELAVAVMNDPRPELKKAEVKEKEGVGKAEAKTRPEEKAETGKKPARRFHTASSPFAVERDLKVAVATKRKGDAKGPIRPGEEVEVTVTTTDPQGKPVAAELSLALVEQSLLERFSFPVPAIQDFFRGNLRAPAVRTTSSVTFEYRPTTRPINPQLLAEAERLEVAREEAASRLSIEGRERAAAVDTLYEIERSYVPFPDEPPVAYPDGATWGELSERRRAAAGERLLPQLTDRFGDDANQADFNFYSEATPQDGRAQMGLMGAYTGNAPAGGRPAGFGARGGGQPLTGRQTELQAGLGMLRQQARTGVQSNANRSLGVSQTQAAGGLVAGVQVEQLGDLDMVLLRGRPEDVRQVMETIKQVESLSVAPAKGEVLFGRALAENRKAVTTVDKLGRMQEWNIAANGVMDRRQADALADELNKAGAMLVSGLGPQETGYWNPAVATDKEGKATLTVTMPDRTTGWKFVAKGITQDTLAGETTGDVVVKKDLFGQIKLPMAFTDRDEAEVLVSVHNDAIDKGPIEVTLKTTVAGRSVEEKKTLDVTSKGIQDITFKTTLRRPEPGSADKKEEKKDEKDEPAAEVNAAFELTVSAGPNRDVARRAVPLLPYGMSVYATASGTATSDTTAWVEPPAAMPFEAPSLQILVGPTIERSLLDIVLGPAPLCQIEVHNYASGLDTATSDLMASLGLQKLVSTTRDAGSPQAQALDGRVRGSVSLLVSSQQDDGGWSWTGRGGKSDRYGSARAFWGLSLAKAAGYPVPEDCTNKALGYLKNQLTATDNSDYESKAILLHALSTAGQGDFALANRLYRERPSLSAAALVQLALAFIEMDRKPTAGELLGLVAQRNLDEPTLKRQGALGVLPWSHSPAELRALYALALQKVTPQAPKAKELVDWLLAHRAGNRWAPDKATGPAALALATWFSESRFQGEHYQLAVFVNDVQVKVLDMDEAAGTQAIDVPAKWLKKGKERINFRITGRGRYAYQCILGGFVPADKLKSTSKDWQVQRYHEPAPLELDGKEIPRGFGVLEGSYTTFRNPLTQLPVGRRGQVELNIWRHTLSGNVPEEQLEYLVVTEPIPSGATVIEKSVQGGFERFEIGPGAITFYVGTRRFVEPIRYELHGYLPGSYRAAPSLIRNAYRPDQLAVSTPKPLAVLSQGAKSADAYRLTPQELYELGKRYFEKKDFSSAQQNLTELFEKWNLRTEVYKDAVQKLLDVHLELGPPGKVVRYFEIIKEKWPAEEIPFDKIVKVGLAYHEMGEYERAYLIFRATVESSFGRESGVAGFLESQGEFLRSVDVMGRLLREYPPEGYVAAATYALAQRVYAKAPVAAEDPKLRQQKVNRVDLIHRAWAMLESFLTAHPDDPAADQASFAAANALLDVKQYKTAAAACNRYAERYPKSELVDSYWYIIGYCYFATGQHKAALEMCRRVAEATRVDPRTGAEKESANKWRAIYILGQIYHSLGEAAQAISEYRRVEDRFADAKEAIQYFMRKAIELPEVTTVKPGTPADVELKFRNIPACDVKVYAIDLMKFSLLKRNLGGITQINLAGIRPYHEAALALGDGKDFRDRTQKLPLPLKEEGAYLVVCRGQDLYASGLVLVTPLAVEVQEEVSSGRVRTTVKDVTDGRYVNEVHVKVIGSRNPDFVSGSTDLRGVFVADGIKGTSTVIAQVDPSRYAFFRGQTNLVPQEAPRPEPAAAPAQQPADQPGKEPASAPSAKAGGKPSLGKSLDQQLLEGLQETNTKLQGEQVEQLKLMYKREQKGVEAQKAY